MTKMPEMASLLNGFGGLSAALISLVWIVNNQFTGKTGQIFIVLLSRSL